MLSMPHIDRYYRLQVQLPQVKELQVRHGRTFDIDSRKRCTEKTIWLLKVEVDDEELIRIPSDGKTIS